MALVLVLAAARAGADSSLPVTGPLGLHAASPEIGNDPSLRGPKQAPDATLLDRCDEYADAHGITIDRFKRRFVGNHSSFFSPCSRTADGGVLLVGTVGDEVINGKLQRAFAVIVRFDASWHVTWKRQLGKARYRTHEGSSGIIAPDGDVLVAVDGFVNPAVNPVTWLLRLRPSGTTRWEATLPGAGTGGTPCPQSLRLLDDGGVLLEGHSYPDGKAWDTERAYHWRGLVDFHGKLILDEVGAPLR